MLKEQSRLWIFRGSSRELKKYEYIRIYVNSGKIISVHEQYRYSTYNVCMQCTAQ